MIKNIIQKSMNKLLGKKWFWFLIIIPLFNPTAFKYIPFTIKIYDMIQAWKLFALIIICHIYLSKRKISSFVILIVLFELTSIITSAVNGIYDLKVYTNALIAIGVSMMAELAIRNGKKAFLSVLFIVLYCLSIINCCLAIIYPYGLKMATLYTTWKNPLYFLSIDNGLIKEFLPLMVVSTLLFYNADKLALKKSITILYSSFAVSFISLFISGSMTGLISFTIFTVTIVVSNIIFKQYIPYKIMIGIYVVFTLVVIVFGFNLKIVSTINTLMGRSNTFTGRSLLWSAAIYKITKRPFSGYGYTAGNIQIWGTSMSSHNLFLELILQGGIIYFIIFILLSIRAIKRNRKADMKQSNIVFLGIFTYLLIGMLEVGIPLSYYILLTIAWYPETDCTIKNIVFKL
ncbi:O-antigen ligase family protein [Enterocloster aldenensis]|uniref:O-antigen ligase family protein n=1 Tax=Enterocloster aldenensis TaxID=358742 RepID=UPI0040289693